MALHDDVTSTATGSPLIYYTEAKSLTLSLVMLSLFGVESSDPD